MAIEIPELVLIQDRRPVDLEGEVEWFQGRFVIVDLDGNRHIVSSHANCHTGVYQDFAGMLRFHYNREGSDARIVYGEDGGGGGMLSILSQRITAFGTSGLGRYVESTARPILERCRDRYFPDHELIFR